MRWLVAIAEVWIAGMVAASVCLAQEAKPLVVQSQVEQIKPAKDAAGAKYADTASLAAQLSNEKQKNLNLSLQNTQLQQQVNLLQQQNALKVPYDAEEKKIEDWIDAMKKANGWGDDVTYDREADIWNRTIQKPPAQSKTESK